MTSRSNAVMVTLGMIQHSGAILGQNPGVIREISGNTITKAISAIIHEGAGIEETLEMLL